jgi:hypothetical protein
MSFGVPRRAASPWLAAGKRFGTALRWLGIGPPTLDQGALLSRAIRSRGLDDFGSPALEEPLRELLAALDGQAALSDFGRYVAHWDLLRLLDHRLLLQDAFNRQPALAQQPLTAPLVITGLPRSGSTFLHRLLAQDPAHRVPRHFEVQLPFASEGDEPRRRRQVQRDLAILRKLAPELAQLHPLTPDTPQECTEVHSASFISLRFDTTYTVTAYRDWIDRRGAAGAYGFQRRLLQFLQAQDNEVRRWVLKSPDHVFTMPDLLGAFPDARLIVTHRHPREVLPSVIRLTVVLRQIFSDRVDAAAVAREVAARWARGAQVLLDARNWASRSGPALHLDKKSIVADPMATIARIYRHFELPLTAAAEAAMRGFVARHRDGDYGRNRYPSDQYGVPDCDILRGFEAYAGAYGFS